MSAACQYDSERSLNNGTLKATRSYYDWDTYGGRLHTIQSGTTYNPTSMQNLTYQAYDNNGNILRLDNPYEKNLSGTQVTARTLYTYDDLNHLIETEMLHLTLPTQYYLQGYGYDDLGRLETKGGTSLTYSEPNGKLHAVSAAGSITYQYDANGNMTVRNTGVPSTSFAFSYDSENRLSMATSSNTTVRFVYDGDGSRVLTTQTVLATITTTAMIGGIYEWVSSSNWTKYYFAGSERIALMKYSNNMYYLFSDHLGSTVVTRYPTGTIYRNGYYPFGEERYTSSYTPYQFTGQRKEAAIGLYDYHARFYDPSIGRFVQADTIVPGPGSPQSWDRYAYVNNNPVRYSDPSGHVIAKGCSDPISCGDGGEKIMPWSKNQSINYPSVNMRGILLQGPVGDNLGIQAQNGYTGFSSSGESNNPAIAGYTALPGFIDDQLIAARDMTNIRELELFGLGNNIEVEGSVFYELLDYGWRIKGIQIQNNTFESLTINKVFLDTYYILNPDRLVTTEKLYPYQMTTMVKSNLNLVQPFSQSYFIPMDSQRINNFTYAKISIWVNTASRRIGTITTSFTVNPNIH
jgi:RHS repeat-associated protein